MRVSEWSSDVCSSDLDLAESEALQREDEHGVEGRDRDAGEQRYPEQQLQCDRGTETFGEIHRDDRDLAQHPQCDRGDRQSVGKGKSVSVCLVLGCRRIDTKTSEQDTLYTDFHY